MVGSARLRFIIFGLAMLVLATAGILPWCPDDDDDRPLPPDASPEALQLARKFAPVLYLVGQGPDCDEYFDSDPYAPTSVSAFLNNPEVRLIDQELGDDRFEKRAPSEADIFRRGGEYYLDIFDDVHPRNFEHRCHYNNAYDASERVRRQEGAAPVVYARVVSRDNKTALQYWFFYYFNDWVNRHEGDFEVVQLLFEADSAATVVTESISPTTIGYSQHTGGRKYLWPQATTEPDGSTHPVVYVAAGSHSNYKAAGFWHTDVKYWFDGCDWTGGREHASRLYEAVSGTPSGQQAGSQRSYELLLVKPADAPGDDFAWSSFKGNWGELSFFSYSGPDGMPEATQWNPWSWNKSLKDGEQGRCALREGVPPQRSSHAGYGVLRRVGDSFSVDDIPELVGDVVIFIITWPGSDFELTLERPDGKIIDGKSSTEVVLHEEGDNYEVYRLENAPPGRRGEWKMHIRAKELDAPETVLYEVFDLPAACEDVDDASSRERDADLDGLLNREEDFASRQPDPCDWDTDDDNESDGFEALESYFDALNTIMMDHRSEAADINDRRDTALDDATSREEAVEAYRSYVGALADLFARLKQKVEALVPPAAARGPHDEFVQSLAELDEELRRIQREVRASDEDPEIVALLNASSRGEVIERMKDTCEKLQDAADAVPAPLVLAGILSCSDDDALFFDTSPVPPD